MSSAPILDNKDPDEPSVFEPAALLREARRQKGLSLADVPPLCILDPDGDIVRRLRNSGQAKLSDRWPCYHTELYEFTLAGKTAGIIGCVVGAPFAVLVAEELFACGCRVLISVTSAGQINPAHLEGFGAVIHLAGENLGADNERLFGRARPDELFNHRDPVEKARAGRGDIEGSCLHCFEIVLNKTGGCGKGEIRSDGGDDDQVEFRGVYPCHGQSLFCGPGGKGRGILTLGSDAPLLDPGPGGDPVVAGIHHPFQIEV